MNKELKALETLRRRLEAVRHQIGSMSDYLDRGRPSPDEAQKTHAAMAEQEAVATSLEAQLMAIVAAHRQNMPHLIGRRAEQTRTVRFLVAYKNQTNSTLKHTGLQ